MKSRLIVALAVLPVVLAFVWVCVDFGFYQDDAFINFRYVANYLNGEGLVFNIGERVEGFTNFGWVVWLLVWGVVGISYILAAKITGIMLGGAAICLAYPLATQCIDREMRWSALIPVYLVGGNFSFAYWCQAGLETAAFALVTALTLYLFLKRSYQLIAVLTIGVVIRPEGALLAVILMIAEAIVYRRRPLFSLHCTLAALASSLPLIVFKVMYYGGILPNTFFAKAGFGGDQLSAGIEYTFRFLTHYPFLGVGLVLPPLLWRGLPGSVRIVWLFSIVYVLYTVAIGGDVLKVHRFYLPILLPLSVLVVVSISQVVRRLKLRWRYAILTMLTIGMLTATYFVPNEFISHYERMEKGLVHKFRYLGQQIKKADDTDFTVALSTIGALGYELMGHHVIDMLGLTDTTIARHPELPIKGMKTTWKERRFNSRYILEHAPNYVVFSTGQKPSAPAEKALMLHPEFLHSYRTVSWAYQPSIKGYASGDIPVFKKVREVAGTGAKILPIEFVDHYRAGLDQLDARNFRLSQEHLLRATELAGKHPYPYLKYKMVFNHFALGETEEGFRQLHSVLSTDSLIFEPHADLFVYEYARGNLEAAAIHRNWMLRLAPWQVPRFDSLAERAASARRR